MNIVDDYQDEEPDLFWGFLSLTLVSKFIGKFLYNFSNRNYSLDILNMEKFA